VSMGGPSSVKPNTQCYWWASASGGTPGYSYLWSGGLYGSPSGTDYYAYSPSSGSFTVKVTVTDALGATATATKVVTVSSLARPCPI
ncbi:MAG TPA: PKD domain-containing protein, partial [Longimicrobium sp.]|nr:PKD domain-containing protein [Longimicrobium sp.]